jgi:hypothetical protein
MDLECLSNRAPFPQSNASSKEDVVASSQKGVIVLSKKDLCVLCFCDIYGAPFEIFGEWRNGALYF